MLGPTAMPVRSTEAQEVLQANLLEAIYEKTGKWIPESQVEEFIVALAELSLDTAGFGDLADAPDSATSH